jgi:predicted nucleotidyltransferase component of viral defense system
LINRESRERAWIDDIRKNFRRADPGLIEKVVCALTLLEQLVLVDLDFVFKGGTAVLLSLDRLDRFSIDIDIVMPERPVDFEEKLGRAVAAAGFIKFEPDERKHALAVRKEHYKCYFQSVTTKFETAIILDVIFDKPTYGTVLEIPIESRFLKTTGAATRVRVPRLEGLLADKLATFAPDTIGIEYGREKGLSIAKQLYDISRLFDSVRDLAAVKDDFARLVAVEARYKKLKGVDVERVLDDCFSASLMVARRGKESPERYGELMDGVQALRAFLFNGSPTRDDAVMWVSKAAYLSRLLRRPEGLAVERHDPAVDLKAVQIDGNDFNQLNKIKKFSPDGFFYWHKAIGLHRKP